MLSEFQHRIWCRKNKTPQRCTNTGRWLHWPAEPFRQNARYIVHKRQNCSNIALCSTTSGNNMSAIDCILVRKAECLARTWSYEDVSSGNTQILVFTQSRHGDRVGDLRTSSGRRLVERVRERHDREAKPISGSYLPESCWDRWNLPLDTECRRPAPHSWRISSSELNTQTVCVRR